MGMDLIPNNEKAEGFRRNWWGWRNLWRFAVAVAPIPKADKAKGTTNDGSLSARSATLMARALEEAIASGKAANFIAQLDARLDATPDEICEYCRGTGKRGDGDFGWCGGCNACHGKGKVRPFATFYRFDLDDVKELAKFLRASRGFKFC